MKAIVIDIVNNEAALLKEDGSILKVANHGYQIGQEVVLEYAVDKGEAASDSAKAVKKPLPLRTLHISRGIIAAAIAATLLFTIGICAYAMPYGTVTDEDSSIEYTINMFDRVIDVNATDEHGATLLADAENHKNQKIGDVLKKTCKAGTSIKVETGSEHHDKKLTEELNQIIENSENSENHENNENHENHENSENDVNNKNNANKKNNLNNQDEHEVFEGVTSKDPDNAEMINNGEPDHKEPDPQYEAPSVHESPDTTDSKPQQSTDQTPAENVPESIREDDLKHSPDDSTHKSESEMSVPQEPASKEEIDTFENNETGAAGSAPESAPAPASAPEPESTPEVPDDRPEINESGEPPKEPKSGSVPPEGTDPLFITDVQPVFFSRACINSPICL